MSVEDILTRHGFRISASCAGQAWYTKFIKYEGRRAYITVMDEAGEGLPQRMDEPVLVGIYDLRSGDELDNSRTVSSLKEYLESLVE